MSHGGTMDRIYRYQRYFYDATRPLFLPGRNALLDAIHPFSGEQVLEMGCGTARNLIRLARRFDNVRFYGVDASSQMLETANRNIRRAGLADRIVLRCENAEDVTFAGTFSLPQKFDKIFFSYSLTMMPTWAAALDAAQTSLAADGSIFIVDFWNLKNWPAPMRFAFNKWLSLFHVCFREEMIEELRNRFPNIEIRSLLGGYAYLAVPNGLSH